jgi:hypothetical protein
MADPRTVRSSIETGTDSFRLAHTRAKTSDQTQPAGD